MKSGPDCRTTGRVGGPGLRLDEPDVDVFGKGFEVPVSREQRDIMRLGRGRNENVHRPSPGLATVHNERMSELPVGASDRTIHRERLETRLHLGEPSQASCAPVVSPRQVYPEMQLCERRHGNGRFALERDEIR